LNHELPENRKKLIQARKTSLSQSQKLVPAIQKKIALLQNLTPTKI